MIASGNADITNLPLGNYIAGIIALLTAGLALYSGWVASRTARARYLNEKRKFDDGRRKQSVGPSTAPLLDSTERTPLAIAASIEGYVIRFILLYLTYEIVRLLLGVIDPLLGYSVYLLRTNSAMFQFLVSASVGYINLAVYAVVFVFLGFPLFKDILASIELRPSEIFSTRLRLRRRAEVRNNGAGDNDVRGPKRKSKGLKRKSKGSRKGA